MIKYALDNFVNFLDKDGGVVVSTDGSIFTPTFGETNDKNEAQQKKLDEWLEKAGWKHDHEGQMPLHPVRVKDHQKWFSNIGRKESEIYTHSIGFAGVPKGWDEGEALDSIRRDGLKKDLRSKGTKLFDRQLNRKPAVYSYSFNQWLRDKTDLNKLRYAMFDAVFIILTPSLQSVTEVHDDKLTHKDVFSSNDVQQKKKMWDAAKRKYGEDISHIQNPEYATLQDIPESNIILGFDILQEVEKGEDIEFNVLLPQINEKLQSIINNRKKQNILKSAFEIHVLSNDYIKGLRENVEKGKFSSIREPIEQNLENSMIAGELELVKQAPGLPPRPGLQWKPSTHRWIRPQEEIAGKLKRTEDKPGRMRAPARVNLDSAVIILTLPEEAKEKLTFEKGTPPEDMHVTLVYMSFPKINWDTWIRKMEEAMSKVSYPDKIIGKISKLHRFENVKDEQGNPMVDAIVAAIESPEIVQLRNQLADELEKVGISIDKTRAEYLPHITLLYLKHGEPSPIDELEQQKIIFDGLELWDPSDRHIIELSKNE